VAFTIRLILMALVWAALQGSFSLINLGVGAAFGALVLWFVQPIYAALRPDEEKKEIGWRIKQVWRVGALLAVFLWELLKSSLTVAYEVLRPRLRVSPGIIALPLDARTDMEITVLANLISLTPGTLSLDVSEDRETLYIHAMFVDDEEAKETRQHIKRRLEHWVIRALGATEGPG